MACAYVDHCYQTGGSLGVAKRPIPRIARLREVHDSAERTAGSTSAVAQQATTGLPSKHVVAAIHVNDQCARPKRPVRVSVELCCFSLIDQPVFLHTCLVVPHGTPSDVKLLQLTVAQCVVVLALFPCTHVDIVGFKHLAV
jgi:hypothetical protein